ncbi:FAD-dependent oxidoreductase [Desulfitobacterium hafniense]|uniref:Fumarate reductase n=3 Tax=Desulfitobacterium hafniense TaxID=49338 RepID=A0A0W1JFL3_DESHA|nr:FAD-dependent oxidoreductase [Desulfitobacterium hafniense]EHL05885.1 FAD binding domain protein [Desulfitobacterium hafniense DP7]KTE90336.1 fumarate reductase [Desulfitobacterium hafniense]BAE82761.1 putative fumarate reductase flavoprotein subunit [Desulfitobacterium hafniense Y51]
MKNECWIKTDVLVVGGGSAGTMAALEARKTGQEVALVDKGGIYRSGCGAAGNDHFLAVLESGPDWDTPEVFLQWYKRLTQGLSDIKIADKVFVRRIKSLVKELEEMGIPMKDPGHKEYIRTRSFAQPGDYFINFDGRALKPMISKRAEQAGVKLYAQIAITDLLVKEGKAVGAVGFHIRTGDFYVFQAKVVVLATGNATRMYENPSGMAFNTWHSPYNTGTAQAMTLRAGGEVKNLEFVNYTITPKNFSASALNAVVGMGGHLVNAKGERYVFTYHEKGEQGPRWAMPWGTYIEEQEGRGPCYFDVRHLSEKDKKHLLEHLLPVDKNTFMDYCEQKGIDPGVDLMEIQISEGQHPAFLGSVSGIFVDECCRTTLPGLFAGGACAVGIGSLAGSMCFGQSAGAEAAQYALQNRKGAEPSPEQIAELKQTVYAPYQSRGDYTYQEAEDKLRQIMSDYLSINRSAEGLKTGWQELNKLQETFGLVKAENGHDLMRIHELRDLLLISKGIAFGALTRTESRFGLSHYRRDYPETRAEWHKSTHLTCRDGELQVHYVPADS